MIYPLYHLLAVEIYFVLLDGVQRVGVPMLDAAHGYVMILVVSKQDDYMVCDYELGTIILL